jgi:Flp pilus assembly protein CpaB
MAGALAAGLIAVFLVFNYVRGVENQQQANVQLVDVYVAKGPIAEGTLGEQAIASGAIALSKVNAEFRPVNAISSPDEIAAKGAAFGISNNTVITQGMFVDPADASLSFQGRLSSPDFVAVTVNLDQVRAAGGFVSSGDFVNIMLVVPGVDGAPPSVSLLYQKVRVLVVGDGCTEYECNVFPGGLITFEVPQEAAMLITAAGQSGYMYLSLVPDTYVPTPYPTATIGGEAGLPGQIPSQLTPYGPEGFQGP